MVKYSEEKDLLIKAQLVIQKKIITLKKGGDGQYGKYLKYEDLLEDLKPILSDSELLLSQDMITVDGIPSIQTMVIHPSGQFKYSISLETPGNASHLQPAQNRGSGIKYIKRYALLSFFAIGDGDKDIDEMTATKTSRKITLYRTNILKLLDENKIVNCELRDDIESDFDLYNDPEVYKKIYAFIEKELIPMFKEYGPEAGLKRWTDKIKDGLMI